MIHDSSSHIGLYGSGASPHSTIQIARHWGCQVYVTSLKQEHRHLARGLVAAWVGIAIERFVFPFKRILNILDEYTRECLASVAARRIRSHTCC